MKYGQNRYLIVYDTNALVATLAIQLSGGLNALGWSIVCGYFLIKENK